MNRNTLHIALHVQHPGFALQAQLDVPLQGVTVLWGA